MFIVYSFVCNQSYIESYYTCKARFCSYNALFLCIDGTHPFSVIIVSIVSHSVSHIVLHLLTYRFAHCFALTHFPISPPSLYSYRHFQILQVLQLASKRQLTLKQLFTYKMHISKGLINIFIMSCCN